jgi:CBS domain-containing protein
MPTVNQYMSSDPVTARAGEGLLDVARRMRELHVGCVIIVEGAASDRRPIGILTDRDIVVGVLAQTDQKLHLLRVDDVMTRKLVVANEDDDLDEVLRRMRAKGVRRVPVVDSYGLVKGIIAADDILEHVREQVDAIVTLIGRERSREEKVRGRRSGAERLE